MMRRHLARFREQERDALDFRPERLPEHHEEARFQRALEGDAVYERLVLAALSVAFFAGLGFAILPRHQDWLPVALWCITGAGLAARCVGSRLAWSHRVVTRCVDDLKKRCEDAGIVDCTPLLRRPASTRLETVRTRDGGPLPAALAAGIRLQLEILEALAAEARLAQARNLRLLAALVAVFGGMGILCGWQVIAATLGVGALLLLVSANPGPGSYLGAIAVLALGAAAPVYAWEFSAVLSGAAAPTRVAETIYLFAPGATGLGLAIIAIAVARDPLGTVNVAEALTRTAAAVWAFATWGRAGTNPLDLVMFAAAAGCLLWLDVHAIFRRSFVPTVATAMLFQLAAAPPDRFDLQGPLAAHVLAALVVFLLLIAAGYRHTVAGIRRLTPATYIAKSCIVARLDETRGFPVEIHTG